MNEKEISFHFACHYKNNALNVLALIYTLKRKQQRKLRIKIGTFTKKNSFLHFKYRKNKTYSTFYTNIDKLKLDFFQQHSNPPVNSIELFNKSLTYLATI